MLWVAYFVFHTTIIQQETFPRGLIQKLKISLIFVTLKKIVCVTSVKHTLLFNYSNVKIDITPCQTKHCHDVEVFLFQGYQTPLVTRSLS